MVDRIVATSRPQAPMWFVMVAAAGVATSAWAAPDARGVVGALLALVVLAIAVCDARHGIIPNEFNVAGFALAMLHAVLTTPEFAFLEMTDATLRGGNWGSCSWACVSHTAGFEGATVLVWATSSSQSWPEHSWTG
jgi:hypothetical protein